MPENEHRDRAVLDHVVKAIANDTVDDLTVADILGSLEAVGIRTFEDVAARLLQKAKSETVSGPGTPSPIDLDAFRRQPDPALEAAIEHPVPQVPFQWRGKEHPPEDIERFNGKAIGYLPTITGAGEVRLRITDDMPRVRSWLEARHVNRLMTSSATAAQSADANATLDFPANVQVGEHELAVIWDEGYPQLYVGNILTLDPGWWYADLTGVWLNWPWTDWNDQISYVGGSRSYCAFWDHTHGQGSVLLVSNHQGFPFLTQIGWNDRISSFANYG